MSEPKTRNFMGELDRWTDANVIGPLFTGDPNQEDWPAVTGEVKKAIREKVLESYHNGRAAGAKAPAQPGRFRPRQ